MTRNMNLIELIKHAQDSTNLELLSRSDLWCGSSLESPCILLEIVGGFVGSHKEFMDLEQTKCDRFSFLQILFKLFNSIEGRV